MNYPLSTRQREILEYLSEQSKGAAYIDIAVELDLSVERIKQHIHKLRTRGYITQNFYPQKESGRIYAMPHSVMITDAGRQMLKEAADGPR